MNHQPITSILSYLQEYLSFNWTELILIAFLYILFQLVCRQTANIFHQFWSFWHDDLYMVRILSLHFVVSPTSLSLQDYTNPEGDMLSDGSYPNGWIPIAESQQLASGALIKIRALGQDIVVVRDSNGIAHAMDPYCPHNGAHLGSGEVVRIHEQDCVRCPFHEWSFRVEDGACVDVPYAKDRSG